jgi:hypothetical protein
MGNQEQEGWWIGIGGYSQHSKRHWNVVPHIYSILYVENSEST